MRYLFEKQLSGRARAVSWKQTRRQSRIVQGNGNEFARTLEVSGEASFVVEGAGLAIAQHRLVLGNVGSVEVAQRFELRPGASHDVMRLARPHMVCSEYFEVFPGVYLATDFFRLAWE